MLLHFSHNPGRTTHSAMLAPLPAFPLALLLRSLAVAPMHVLRIQPLPPKLKVPFTRTSSPHSPTSVADPSPVQLCDEVSVCTFLSRAFDSEHNLPLTSPFSTYSLFSHVSASTRNSDPSQNMDDLPSLLLLFSLKWTLADHVPCEKDILFLSPQDLSQANKLKNTNKHMHRSSNSDT